MIDFKNTDLAIKEVEIMIARERTPPEPPSTE